MATTASCRWLSGSTFAAVAAGLAMAIAAGSVRAQNWMPILPDQDFYDFQVFAPPDLQEYGVYRDAREGFFFEYDRLYLGITRPKIVSVAQGFDTVAGTSTSLVPTQPINAASIVNLNNQLKSLGLSSSGLIVFGSDELQLDLNSSWMQTAMSWGNRYQLGWIYDDAGILVDYFDTGKQSQSFTTKNQFAINSPFTQLQTNVAVSLGAVQTTQTINAISPQPDHAITQTLAQHNTTEIQSAAAAAVIRRQLGARGSGRNLLLSLGPRFLQLDDRFGLTYASTTSTFNAGTQPQATSVTINSGQSGATSTNNTGSGSLAGSASNINTTAAGASLNGEAAGNVVGPGLAFQNASWSTHTINNLVGPEFGLRFENDAGRWSFSADLKFTPGFNWQNNMYRGANLPATLAADYLRSTFQFSQQLPSTEPPPPLLLQVFGLEQSNATNQADYKFVFSPIGEWRLGAEFRVSQAISLNAGYNGMWLGSVARAVTNTGYNTVQKRVSYAAAPETPDNPTSDWRVVTKDVPYSRIGPAAGSQQNLFVNGIEFGINVNY